VVINDRRQVEIGVHPGVGEEQPVPDHQRGGPLLPVSVQRRPSKGLVQGGCLPDLTSRWKGNARLARRAGAVPSREGPHGRTSSGHRAADVTTHADNAPGLTPVTLCSTTLSLETGS
jgi:hypothetical protein